MDLDEIERLDRLGFERHGSANTTLLAWERCPAPDLLIAQALKRTERIHLGPLGFESCQPALRSLSGANRSKVLIEEDAEDTSAS